MKLFFSFVLIFVAAISTAQKPELMITRGHSGNIVQIISVPGDKYVISTAWDLTIRVWEQNSGRLIKIISGIRRFPARALTVSADGKLLAIGGTGDLRVYSIGTDMQLIYSDTTIGWVKSMAFNSTGSLLAISDHDEKDGYEYKEIQLLSTDGFNIIKRFATKDYIEKIQFLQDGNLVGTTTSTIEYINAGTGKLTKEIDYSPFYVGELSPNAEIVTYYDTDERHSKQYFFAGETATKNELLKTPLDYRATTANTFSPDGKYMAEAVTGSIINVWDLTLKTIVYTLKDNGKIKLLKFNASGNRLLSSNEYGDIRVWDFKQQVLRRNLKGEANTIYSISLNYSSNQLAVSGNNIKGFYQCVMDVNASVLKDISGKDWVPTLKYSPDGSYLVMNNRFGSVSVYNTSTFEKLQEFPGNNKDSNAFAISAGGRLLAVTNDINSSKISIYNLPGGELQKTLQINPSVHSLCFSPDGKMLFAGCNNNRIVQFNIETGIRVKNMLQTVPEQDDYYNKFAKIKKVLVTRDGNIVTGDYLFMGWLNSATGKRQASLFTSVENCMLEFNNSEQIAVCGSSTEAEPIRIIDNRTHSIVQTLTGHTTSPNSLAITKDDKFLFSGSDDRTVKIWNVASGEMLATLVFFNAKDWVIVDNQGRFDGTQDGMKKMYYVKGLEVMPLESGFENFYTPNLLPRILEGENFVPLPVNIITLKDAPKVKITAEEMQRNLTVEDETAFYSTTKEQITIKVKADCPNDGVTEIRLFQNGKLVETTRNLLVEDENKSEKSLSKTFTVTLAAGDNRFKTIAFNTERTESKPAEIIIKYKLEINAQPVAVTTTLHLIVVGVNTYKNPKYSLNYALADAASVAEAITEGSKNLFTQLNSIFIKDADATKEGIINAFEKIKAAAKPQDMFVFYFAGHGAMDNKDEFFIVPYDVTQIYGNDDALAQKGISADLLKQMSTDIKAQKQVFILDACHSAGALTALVSSRGAAEENAIAQLARSTGSLWFAASGTDQFASEFAQLGHGAFTYCLLQAFKGDANPADKKLTVKQLDAYLNTKVPEITQKFKGTPQYPQSFGMGNDFPIIIVK